MTKIYWKPIHFETTLETSGEDVPDLKEPRIFSKEAVDRLLMSQNTLETGGEDVKITLETGGEDFKRPRQFNWGSLQTYINLLQDSDDTFQVKKCTRNEWRR
jgi:hypothetical protein